MGYLLLWSPTEREICANKKETSDLIARWRYRGRERPHARMDRRSSRLDCSGSLPVSSRVGEATALDAF